MIPENVAPPADAARSPFEMAPDAELDAARASLRDEQGELTRKTTGGAAWLIIVRLAMKFIDFLSLLVLARLLGPADFGIIAIAMTSILIVEAVFELPVYQVLISTEVIERFQLDTAFTLGALRGLVMAVALTLIAVPFAHLYHDPRLIGLIAILSFAPAIRGISNPRMVIFVKRMDFSKELCCEVASKVVSFVFSLIAAWVFRDYRALMVNILVTPAVWTATSYLLVRYRPRLSLKAWPQFAHFMSWTTLSQLMAALTWQSDRLVLGAFVGRAELGNFSLANDLSYMPEQALIRPIVRPLVSAFAVIRDDAERLASAHLKAATTVLAVGTPVLLSLGLLAGPVVAVVLGPKWEPAIPILQWLAVTLIPPLYMSPFSALAIALGRPDQVLWQNATEAASKVPFMILGVALAGIDGAIAARGFSAVMTAGIVLYLTKRLIGTTILRQVAATWRVVAGALVLVGILLALEPFLPRQAGLIPGFLLALVGGAGCAAYVLTIVILWHLAGRPGGVERTVSDRLVGPVFGRIARALR